MESHLELSLMRQLQEAGVSWVRMQQILQQVADTPVGVTPKDLVWSRNKARLYRYRPLAEQRHRIPVLLIYALINRPYVMDLYPGRSFVEALLQQGFDVFLLDWGTAGPEDRGLKFDDYVLDYIPGAVRKVLRLAGTEQLSVVGYCIGGVLSLLYAALHADGPLRNLVLLATPVDFKDADLYTVWLNPAHLDVDEMVDTWGNIPPEAIGYASKLLKPVANWVRPYQGLAERHHDDKFVRHWLAINRWVEDNTPFPGEAFRQWIKAFYQENRLVKGELTLRGRPVKLSRVRANLLNIVATEDHIVQPSQSLLTTELVGSSDRELFSVKTGHVSIMTGSQGPRIVYPKVAQWLGERPG